MTQVTEPFPIFYDDDGTPLENGMIYIGQANQEPRANPVTVYVDEALTVPIAQPIRTLGGRPAYQGAPVNLYISQATYSIAVQNKYGTPIVSDNNVASDFITRVELAATGGAALVGYTQGGTGAIARTVQDKLRETPTVEDFGAVGDATEDDTSEIQAAANAAAASFGVLQFVPGKRYRITDTITVAPGVSVDMSGAQLIYAGTKDRPALTIGTSGVSNQSAVSGRRLFIRGLDIRAPSAPVAADLADTDYVGVRFWNLRRCGDVHIENVYGFTRNIEFVSDQALGSTGNVVTLGSSLNSVDHFVFRTNTANGFTTEFLVLGGYWTNDNQFPTTLGSNGVLVTWDKTSSARGADNIVFQKPCFELGERSGAGDRIPVYLDGAGKNLSFQDVRWEACDGPFMYADGGASGLSQNPFATNCKVSLLTASGAQHAEKPIEEVNGAVGSRVTFTSTVDTAYGEVLRPRPITQCIKAGGSANEKFLTGEWLGFTSGAPTPSKTITSNLLKLGPDYVELAAGGSIAVGVAVDTRKRKSFVLKASYKGGGFRGRILLRMYDRFGNQMTSVAGDGSDLLKGYWNLSSPASTALPFSTSTFGHHFRNLNSNFNVLAQSFRVADEVAYVIVAVSNSTTQPARFSNFEILIPPTGTRAGDDAAQFWPVFPSDVMPVSAAAPNAGGSTFGVHYVGERIGNRAAASASPAGWICNSGRIVAPAWVGSTAYVLDDLRANGSNVYVCVTAGTSASSGGPTGTGTGISDGTAEWDFYAPLATFLPEANLP